MAKKQVAPRVKSVQAVDSAKRSARTGIQSSISVSLLVSGWNLFAPHPLTVEQTAWIITAGTAVPTIVSFLMNALEDAGMPALLKTPTAVDPTTTLTPEQMIATAEYLTSLAQHHALEPKLITPGTM
jgi:hypothetical protein